jgi:AraC family transcriptional regulator of adaptative response / DNA-3-methyladenine glycosylase II
VLGPLAAARPWLRSPGGQQVTVAAARNLAGTLVAAYGKPLPAPDGGLTHVFPEPATLAGATLTELGMPAARRETIRGLAAALADGSLTLSPGAEREEAERGLLALRGIGPWTAGYVRMRALGDPDVFLLGDAGIRHGLHRLGTSPAAADAWRPWRSYAVHHLWNAANAATDANATGPASPKAPLMTETR